MARPVHNFGVFRSPDRVFVAILLSALILAVQFTGWHGTASADTEEITVQRVGIEIEYPVSNGPVNVAWESPGRGWFTSPSEDMIGVITRQSASDDELVAVTIEYLPQENGSQPYDVAYANDTVWFTLLGSNQLGRIDLASVSAAAIMPDDVRYYTMPFAKSGPSAVTVAPDGMVWIVSAYRPRLTRFDPATETFSEWSYAAELPAGGAVSTPRTVPDIAVADSNVIWFTIPGSDLVGAYTVDKDRFSRIRISNPNLVVREPAGIALDSGGVPWITSYQTNLVGRYAPGTSALWDWFLVPTPNSGPRGIAFNDNGDTWDIWFAQENARRVGRLVVSPKYDFIAYVDLLQQVGSRPRGVAVGGDDTLWFAESGLGIVSENRPPYILLLRLPIIFNN